MPMKFSVEDFLDFSSDDSGIPSVGALGAVTREIGKDGGPVQTTASLFGYSNTQITTTNAAQLLMGIPLYKDANVGITQNEYLSSALLGVSTTGGDTEVGLGGGFDSLVPSDIKKRAEAIGPQSLGGIVSAIVTQAAANTTGTTPGTDIATGTNTGSSVGKSASTTQLRLWWGPSCYTGEMIKYTLFGGGVVSCRPAVLDALKQLDAALKKYNYSARREATSAYNCRKITGGSGLSLHSFGIAFDINADKNPYGSRLITDMPAAMIAAIKKLKTKNGAQVWRWGGDYSGNKDAMHFEVVCSPSDMATGLDPATMIG